jgi:hypothetical protein
LNRSIQTLTERFKLAKVYNLYFFVCRQPETVYV